MATGRLDAECYQLKYEEVIAHIKSQPYAKLSELVTIKKSIALNSKLVRMQAERDAGGSIILHWRIGEIEEVLIPVIDPKTQSQISLLVQESFNLKSKSEKLLEVAKQDVEMAIEEFEEKGIVLIENFLTTANRTNPN